MYQYDFSNLQGQLNDYAEKYAQVGARAYELNVQYFSDYTNRQSKFLAKEIESGLKNAKQPGNGNFYTDLTGPWSGPDDGLSSRWNEFTAQNASSYKEFIESLSEVYDSAYRMDVAAESKPGAKKAAAA